MIRWEFWVGLLLSISLNIVILLWGIGLFSKQESLFLNQSAGSHSSLSLMTVDLLESQAGSNENRLADKEAEEISQDNFQDNYQEKSQENLVDLLDAELKETTQDNIQKTLPIAESKATAQDPSKKTEQKPKNHETTDQESTRKGNVADQQASTARSGDQFAADIAASIQSQIQGCYPEASQRRGEEGVVYIKISKLGAEVSVDLVQSSGFSRLDRCAISAVNKSMSKIAPEKIPDGGIDLKPIRFQLHNE